MKNAFTLALSGGPGIEYHNQVLHKQQPLATDCTTTLTCTAGEFGVAGSSGLLENMLPPVI